MTKANNKTDSAVAKTSTAVAKTSGVNFADKYEELFQAKVAKHLPSNFAAQEARFHAAVRAMGMNQKELVKAWGLPKLMPAVVRAAQMGVILDNREATIVVYKSKPAFVLMADGARKLLNECIALAWHKTLIIYANDVVEVFHLTDKLPIITRAKPFERGAAIGVLGVAKLKDGRVEVIEMDAEDCAKHKPSHAGSHYGDKWYKEFWKNVCAKKLYKEIVLGGNIWDDIDLYAVAEEADAIDVDGKIKEDVFEGSDATDTDANQETITADAADVPSEDDLANQEADKVNKAKDDAEEHDINGKSKGALNAADAG